MTEKYEGGRRRFLQGAGLGGTALLAGCTDRLGLTQSDDGDGAEGVGVVAAIDQQELQAIGMEVQQEVEAGDLDEEDAPQEVQERQEAFLESEVDEMTTALESESSIEVVEEFPTFGAVRATGDAEDLIDALEDDSVTALVPASELQEPEPTPDEESESE